jgi:hypothetical protein
MHISRVNPFVFWGRYDGTKGKNGGKKKVRKSRKIGKEGEYRFPLVSEEGVITLTTIYYPVIKDIDLYRNV